MTCRTGQSAECHNLTFTFSLVQVTGSNGGS